MTNTWIERGQTPVADLFNGIQEGVYARNWLGGMTNGEMFTFTAGEAWMIRNGEVAGTCARRDSIRQCLQNLGDIEAIGDDFFWDESGGCGKGGQSGLPVGCGGPSLRIRNVVVGGGSPRRRVKVEETFSVYYETFALFNAARLTSDASKGRGDRGRFLHHWAQY
jgi:TldD protein